MLFSILAILANISTSDLHQEFPYSPYDAPIVEDAIAREVERSGGSNELLRENAIPILIRFPEKRCVVIWWRSPVGGKPIYCYLNDEDTLIEIVAISQ